MSEDGVFPYPVENIYESGITLLIDMFQFQSDVFGFPQRRTVEKGGDS